MNLSPASVPIYRDSHPSIHKSGVMLAVHEMSHHMTDEGWQLAQAVHAGGFMVAGRNCQLDVVDVPTILRETEAKIVVIQDPREWDPQYIQAPDGRRRPYRTKPPGAYRDYAGEFQRIDALSQRQDIFRVVVLKDAHQKPIYYREWTSRLQPHAWLVYYHPEIAAELAPYARQEHMIRMYHTVDAELVPPFNPHREGCILSGNLKARFYPLRARIAEAYRQIPELTVLPHPGYHAGGSCTADYLQTLSRFKVSICTASRFGYALRKIIESTAAGCVVVTDLPTKDQLPEIESNLVRVPPDISIPALSELLGWLLDKYDPDRQEALAKAACDWYDYRVEGRRIVQSIRKMQENW